ncbi:MAG TPA: hypothetical protein VGF62_10740, partial [Rhizomicrobium sp.]
SGVIAQLIGDVVAAAVLYAIASGAPGWQKGFAADGYARTLQFAGRPCVKQGFGWLIDVRVGCLWSISQVSRLLRTHPSGASLLKDCRACSRPSASPLRDGVL